MSEENKNLTPEENEEVTPVEETTIDTDIVEDVAEEVAEAAEEAAEELAEDVEEETETVEEEIDEVDFEEMTPEELEEAIANGEIKVVDGEEIDGELLEGQELVEKAKAINKPLVAGVICVLVVIIAAVVLFVNGGKWFNKYNRKYIDITGKTIGQIADENGYDFNDFLVAMELPLDMPENTYESAAVYSRKFSTMAKLYGMSTDELKELLGVGDEVTDDTTWGDAYDMATIEKIVGEESFEMFKEQYGLGDEVTLETKWGEIRAIVDQYERDMMLEQKKAEEEAAKAEAEGTSDEADNKEATDDENAETEEDTSTEELAKAE